MSRQIFNQWVPCLCCCNCLNFHFYFKAVYVTFCDFNIPAPAHFLFKISSSFVNPAALLGPCHNNIAGSQSVYDVTCRNAGCPSTVMFSKDITSSSPEACCYTQASVQWVSFIMQLQRTDCMIGELEESWAVNPLNSLITILCRSSYCHFALTQSNFCSLDRCVPGVMLHNWIQPHQQPKLE